MSNYCPKCNQTYVTSYCWCRFDKKEKPMRPTNEELKDRWRLASYGNVETNAIHLANWAMDQMEKEKPMDPIDKALYNDGIKEPKMEKMMTFEEWYESQEGHISLRNAFADARQGMIPESEAIKVPPVEEWPSWAVSIVCCFSDIDSSVHTRECPGLIKAIPRPRPQWVPKEGDKVAAWDHGNELEPYIIIVCDHGLTSGVYDKAGNHYIHCAFLESLDDIGHDIAWFKANRKWI